MDKVRFTICSTVILIGALVLGEACFSYHRNYRDYTDKVTAQIVDVDHMKNGVNKRVQKPTYQYEYDGECYTIQASYVVCNHRYEVGDEIVLKIKPSEPSQVVDQYILRHNYYDNMFVGIFLLLIGGFFVRILYG